jgi:hypothetical protein
MGNSDNFAITLTIRPAMASYRHARTDPFRAALAARAALGDAHLRPVHGRQLHARPRMEAGANGAAQRAMDRETQAEEEMT